MVELLSSFWNTRWLAAPLPEQRRALRAVVSLCLTAAAALAGSGCAGPNAAGVESTAAGPPRLVRCGYFAGDCWHYLDTEQPLTEPVVVSARSFAEAARGTENGSAPRPLRDYEIFAGTGRSAGAAAAETFRVVEPAGGSALAARDGSAPWDTLRLAALAACRASVRPPRQILEWHCVALAGFLGQDPPLLTRSEKEILLRAMEAPGGGEAPNFTQPPPDPIVVAQAVLPHAPSLTEGDAARLLKADNVGARLVALTRRAHAGERSALREILTLSLEYQGRNLLLFEAAVRALFPSRSNPTLERLHPPPAAGPAAAEYLADVGRRFANAHPVPLERGGGWSLEASETEEPPAGNPEAPGPAKAPP